MSTKQYSIETVLANLAACYPNFKLPKESATMYERLLADIPLDELRAAAMDCATRSRFFPSVAELREAVVETRRALAGVPSAIEAWGEVSKASEWDLQLDMETNTIIKSRHQWSHPIVERIARMLGWPKFPGENLSTDRAHFIKAYDAALNDAMRQEQKPPELRNGKASRLMAGLAKQLEAGK